MVNVYNETNLCRRFDFSSLITDDDDREICRLCQEMVDSYTDTLPNFADGLFDRSKCLTRENLFSIDNPIFLKYKTTFLTAALLYLGKDSKILNINSWAFLAKTMNNELLKGVCHSHYDPVSYPMTLSGLYYSHIPSDLDYDVSGTEFLPDGPESENSYFIRPARKSWIIFPSRLYHRSGRIDSKETRVSIVGDVQLEDSFYINSLLKLEWTK